MAIDERLEALVTSTELMSGMLKDVLSNMGKLSAHVDTISQLVIIHEARLKRLEGGGEPSPQ
jgi:ACT domain-containing protein